MDQIKKFYKNKKILVTGATGFKGSWLCSWLLELGAKVYGTGFTPNQNKLNHYLHLHLYNCWKYSLGATEEWLYHPSQSKEDERTSKKLY